MVTVSWQTLITAAAVLTAVITLVGRYNKLYDWIKKQDEQDNEIKEMKKEQEILTFGILACLKGLKEQGCNGPVTETATELEEYINAKAHDK